MLNGTMITDTDKRIFLGDEVLEWNGRPLQQLSYQDVHDIIAESKQETQVELIVLRKIPQPYARRRGNGFF